MTPVLNMPDYFVCCLDTSLHLLCEKGSLLRQQSNEQPCRGRRHHLMVSMLGSSSSCWWLNEARLSKARLSPTSLTHVQASLSFACPLRAQSRSLHAGAQG